jgi:hypothetical protein
MENPPPPSIPPEFEQELLTQIAKNIQLSRMIWLLVTKLGGKVEMNEEEVDRLWAIQFNRLPNGRLEVVSEKMPEFSGDQVGKLIGILNGTTKPMREALTEMGLDFYPEHYAELAIAPALVWYKDRWTPRKDTGANF